MNEWGSKGVVCPSKPRIEKNLGWDAPGKLLVYPGKIWGMPKKFETTTFVFNLWPTKKHLSNVS